VAEVRKSGLRQSATAKRGENVINSMESRFDGSIMEPSKQHVPSTDERVIVKFRFNWNVEIARMILIIELLTIVFISITFPLFDSSYFFICLFGP